MHFLLSWSAQISRFYVTDNEPSADSPCNWVLRVIRDDEIVSRSRLQTAVKRFSLRAERKKRRGKRQIVLKHAQHPGKRIVSGAISRVFSKERTCSLTRDSREFFARRRIRSFRRYPAISEGSSLFRETRDKSRTTSATHVLSRSFRPDDRRYFSSTLRLVFLFSVGRERPLLFAVLFWQRLLAGLEHPLQGAQCHGQKKHNGRR